MTQLSNCLLILSLEDGATILASSSDATVFILWDIDPLLDSDRETSNYTTVMAKERSMFPRQRENKVKMEEMIYTRPVPRLYNQDQLAS
jgi:hypothetical protein